MLWKQLLFYNKADQAFFDIVSGESALLFFKQSIANTRALMLGAVLFAVTLVYYQSDLTIVLSWLAAQFCCGIALTLIAHSYIARILEEQSIMRFMTIRMVIGNFIAALFGFSLFILNEDAAVYSVPVVLLMLLMICIITIFRYAMLPSYFITINISIGCPIVIYLVLYFSMQNLIYLLVIVGGINVIIYAGLRMAKTSNEVIILNSRLKEEIKEHVATKEELESIALQDYLTGVGNRRLFERMLISGIARSKRKNKPLLVLYIDLDNFKPINDKFGHEVGDKLLQAVSDRITDVVRVSDTVARIGGDEFSVIMESDDGEDSSQLIVDKFDQHLKQPYYIDELMINTSASVGVAVYPRDGETWDELMRVADKKMYQAKLAHHAQIDETH